MSAGAQGGYQSGKSSTYGALFPYLGQVAGTMVKGLRSIGSGSATTQGMQAITNYANQQMTVGTQNLKSAFAGSGMAQSSDLMRGISSYQQQSQVGLQAQLAQFAQAGIQDQLQAIQEIIELGSGTSKGYQSGWNIGAGASTSIFSNPGASGG